MSGFVPRYDWSSVLIIVFAAICCSVENNSGLNIRLCNFGKYFCFTPMAKYVPIHLCAVVQLDLDTRKRSWQSSRRLVSSHTICNTLDISPLAGGTLYIFFVEFPTFSSMFSHMTYPWTTMFHLDSKFVTLDYDTVAPNRCNYHACWLYQLDPLYAHSVIVYLHKSPIVFMNLYSVDRDHFNKSVSSDGIVWPWYRLRCLTSVALTDVVFCK